jgi:hypothetical protein
MVPGGIDRLPLLTPPLARAALMHRAHHRQALAVKLQPPAAENVQQQGVFFRAYTVQQGQRLGLVGWCANTSRRTVVSFMLPRSIHASTPDYPFAVPLCLAHPNPTRRMKLKQVGEVQGPLGKLADMKVIGGWVACTDASWQSISSCSSACGCYSSPTLHPPAPTRSLSHPPRPRDRRPVDSTGWATWAAPNRPLSGSRSRTSAVSRRSTSPAWSGDQTWPRLTMDCLESDVYGLAFQMDVPIRSFG